MHHPTLPHFIRGFLLFGLLGLFSVTKSVAQVSFTVGNLTRTENLDALPASGTSTFVQNSTIPGLYGERTGTGTTIVAGTGSSNAGALNSFGTSNDRALGSVGSSNAAAGHFTYGYRLKNETGAVITSLAILYNGEQWRNSAAPDLQTVQFSYLVSTSAIETTNPAAGAVPANYVAVSALDFTNSVSGGTAGAIDGNTNRQAKSFTLAGLSIAPGSEIMLRWYDPDHTGSDHGLAIDDLSVTATIEGSGTPTPVLSVNPTVLSGFTTSEGTPSAPKSYTLSGSNLAADVLISAPAGFEISIGSTYTTSLTLPLSNSSVAATSIHVRLIGTPQGTPGGTITHVSGSASVDVTVSGTVFDPNTIASIAVARSQPVNTPISSLPGGKIAGRVTVSNQFNDVAYIQDPTGGIAVFNTAFRSSVQIGDSVQITDGTLGVFNNNKQVTGTVSFTNFGNKGPLTPKVITTTQLPDYEGQLVTVSSAVIRPNAVVASPNPVFVLTPDANFLLNDASGTQEIRVNRGTNIPGNTNPVGPAAITGVVARFNTITQLLPRFTQDLPGSTPYAPAGGNIDRSLTLDVAAWNIEWLGSTGNGPTNEAQQVTNAISVLNSLQSDLIVLEEISSDNALPSLLAGMPGYQGNCSPFVSNNPGHEIPANPATPGPVLPANTQRVCILYKSDVATLISQKPLMEKVENLTGYPTATDNFWASGRYPYLWKFNVSVAGVSKQINVIGLHTKANEGAPNSQLAYNRRKYDVQVLYDTLKAQYPNDLLLLAGDFNDDLDRTVANVATTETTYKPFTDDTARFTGVTKALSDNGFRTYLTEDNVIDHIMVSNELAPAYINGSAGVGTPYLTINDYGNTTSDHVPVLARFDLSKLALLKVQYQNGDNGQATNNQIKPYLKLVNEGTTAVPYSELTIRYWFTAENYAGINTFIDYAQLGNNKVKINYVRQDSPALLGANGYIEYGFEASAGNLAAGGNSGPIQTRLANKDWADLNETDDHSYSANANYVLTDRITVYRNGTLIWGVEPQTTSPVVKLKVLTENKNGNPNSNSISTYLKVSNEGNVPLAYGDLAVRYWFTPEGTTSLNYWIDYAKLGNSNLTGQFVPVNPARSGAETYLELNVKPAAGTLYPLSNTGNIQYRIAKSNWSNFNETNDYSYKAAAPFSENDHVTVYYQGNLIYGIEPPVATGARLSTVENGGIFQVQVLPNPVSDVFEVEFIAPAGETVRLQLTDLHGRTVLQHGMSATGQRQRQSMNVRTQAAGVYFLRAAAGPETGLIKVLKP
ncbi:cellulose binding domain-containing protein [Larkinella rosea]|uniref:T9SS C-terminal target domain-containing protein n=1 Tax=Larkinella rosea TaxID=2025312 RepID=A0A3P1BNU1_9BACT|nr:cellulose binding domain-containing protein [Larkinella rosea]RRB02742.1 T9SS C-terminal target domain-containing protein [Larkinella rosea]